MADGGDSGGRIGWRGRLVPAVPMAVLYALLLYGMALVFDEMDAAGGGALLMIAFLFGVPAATASVAVMAADPRGEAGGGRHALIGAMVTTAFMVVALVLLAEGGICVIMVSPLFYGASILGALLTGLLLRRTRGRAAALLLVMFSLKYAAVSESSDIPPLPVSSTKFSESGKLSSKPCTMMIPPVSILKGKRVINLAGAGTNCSCARPATGSRYNSRMKRIIQALIWR